MRFRHHQEVAQEQTRTLLALFVLVVVGLVIAINLVLAVIYWISFPYARALPRLFIETNTALVLLFVLGGCWVESLRASKGGPHVASLAGARPVQTGGHDEASRRERRFVNVVQEMALASGLRPPPQAWVLPRDDAINALAAGWGPDDAVVAVTRGALERLTRAELQGVVAHEFSHIAYGDTRLNMRLVGMVWGLQMIWGLGQTLWSADERGRRHAGALFGLGLMAVGSFGWLAGRLLQAAVSRQREFLADASAVQFTREVDGLGGALRKIGDQQVRRVPGLASAHAAALAHLLLSHGIDGRGRWRRWLATHPMLSERLARLYGHELAPDDQILTADPLPIAELDDPPDEALARMAPARVAGSAGAIAAEGPLPFETIAPAGGSPEAHRHDATQLPSSFDAAEREREALARITLWHGPGEWQSAMLALAIGGRATGAAAPWRAYAQSTQDLTVAAAVRTEIEALSARGRRRVFESLLQRAQSAAPAQRRRLWQDWSARWRVLHATAAAADQNLSLWRALVIHHALHVHLGRVPARGSLASEAAAVQSATRAIADAMALDGDARRAWLDTAWRGLAEMGMPAPRGPAAGLAPATPQRESMAALRVRRLSPMQRPLLLRAWLLATPHGPLLGDATDPRAADALHLACVALDVPVPAPLT